MARRTLSWVAALAAGALIIIAVAFVRRFRERPQPATPREAPVQRTLALFSVRDTSRTEGDSSSALIARLVSRIGRSGHLRVVSATIVPAVDVAQLAEVLNARTAITLRFPPGVVEMTLQRGDTVIARRTFPARSALEDSLLQVAAALEPSALDPPVDDERARLPDADERLRLAESLFGRGETIEALREARRAHELAPLSGEIHLAYARLLERAGRDADATRERDEQRRIATILNPTPKDQIARARFKHVPKRPPRSPRSSRGARTRR